MNRRQPRLRSRDQRPVQAVGSAWGLTVGGPVLLLGMFLISGARAYYQHPGPGDLALAQCLAWTIGLAGFGVAQLGGFLILIGERR